MENLVNKVFQAIAQIESDERYYLHCVTAPTELFEELKSRTFHLPASDFKYTVILRKDFPKESFALVIHRNWSDNQYPKPLRHIHFGPKGGTLFYKFNNRGYEEHLESYWLALAMEPFRWIAQSHNKMVWRIRLALGLLGEHWN